MRRPACLALLLCLHGVAVGSRASAEGLHPELGVAASGVLNLGDLGTVSRFGVGGDIALHLVPDRQGLGVRAGGGVQFLQGHKIPTDEVIFNGIGTQPATFEASQDYWWIGIGPSWSAPLGSGRVDFYLLAGRALAKATSTVAWSNTIGADPGSTSASLLVLGAAWSPRGSKFELGSQLFAGGSAAFWNDPPVVVDGAGNHVLQGTTASITGIAFRMGYRFGQAAARSQLR
jgi:hypothetical protein